PPLGSTSDRAGRRILLPVGLGGDMFTVRRRCPVGWLVLPRRGAERSRGFMVTARIVELGLVQPVAARHHLVGIAPWIAGIRQRKVRIKRRQLRARNGLGRNGI